MPVPVDITLADIEYTLRGEYTLRYEAEDSSGNQAENVLFAMVMLDHEAPNIYTPTLFPNVVQSCDVDGDFVQGGSPQKILVPPTASARDLYDLVVDDRLTATIATPNGVTSTYDNVPGSSNPMSAMLVDTYETGSYAVTYRVEDFANLFGEFNANNVATVPMTTLVVDTIGPELYCKPQQHQLLNVQLQPGVEAPIELLNGVIDTSACATACFDQQWQRIVGTTTNPLQCAFFKYDENTQDCELHGESAMTSLQAVSAGAAESHVHIGYNVQCGDQPEDANEHECNTPFQDPGAMCIDMRDSLCRDVVADRFQLQSHIQVVTTVDPSKTGAYTMTYSCSDLHANPAQNIVRHVEVQDLTKPDLDIVGLYTNEILCGAEGNDDLMAQWASPGSGFTSVDSCTGVLHNLTFADSSNACSIKLYKFAETGGCPGIHEDALGVERDGGSGNWAEYDIDQFGVEKRAAIAHVGSEVGTWVLKYSCQMLPKTAGPSAERLSTYLVISVHQSRPLRALLLQLNVQLTNTRFRQPIPRATGFVLA